MKKLIYLEDAIDAIITLWADKPFGNPALTEIKECIDNLPSAEPEIIRCRDCGNWKPQVELESGGLGACIFHKANFVTSEGYCYWAERRTDETD